MLQVECFYFTRIGTLIAREKCKPVFYVRDGRKCRSKDLNARIREKPVSGLDIFKVLSKTTVNDASEIRHDVQRGADVLRC